MTTRYLVHDFAGHPFQIELSRALAASGAVVVHAYCGGVASGQGKLERQADDPPGLRIVDVSSEPFERYSPFGRARSEVRYGRALAQLVQVVQPDVVLSANAPLLAQERLWRAARSVGATRVYWLQDFLGRGVRAVFSERHALLGATLGRAIESLETMLLRNADGIVVISDDFLAELHHRGVSTPAIVIENWAPLDEITVGEKVNDWSTAAGLADRPVALYAGTLGLKHDPEHLVAAARSLAGTDAVVVVVSEGLGRAALERAKEQEQLHQLLLLDYVPYDRLGEVLAAADVCLVLLESEAGTFSVPSKVLTYLAAGRPIVGAIPSENLAARTIERAGAGHIVPPGDHRAYAEAVVSMLDDSDARRRAGIAGRAYAEAVFEVTRIRDVIIGFAAAVGRAAPTSVVT